MKQDTVDFYTLSVFPVHRVMFQALHLVQHIKSGEFIRGKIRLFLGIRKAFADFPDRALHLGFHLLFPGSGDPAASGVTFHNDLLYFQILQGEMKTGGRWYPSPTLDSQYSDEQTYFQVAFL